MSKTFYFFAAAAFACLVGMGISAVLIDHDLAPRLAWDLFSMVGILFGLPAVLFGIGGDQ